MKSLLSVVAYSLLLAACSAVQAASLGSYFLYGAEHLKVICEGVDNTFACARQIEARVLKQSKAVKREKDDLLTLAAGGTVIQLQDTRETEDSVNGDAVTAYSYLGLNRALNMHVIHVQYYEGSSITAFDAASGQKIELRGVPVASPNRRQFLAWDGDEAYGNNGFEVWGQNPLSKAWGKSYQQDSNAADPWLPTSVRWLTNQSIRAVPGCSKEQRAASPESCQARYFIRDKAANWRSAP